MLGASTASLMAVVICAVLAGPAYADPPADPGSPGASDAARQLEAAERDAEVLTEQWHAAQDRLTARQDEERRAWAAIGPAQLALVRAQAAEAASRSQVDEIATEALQGGRLDELGVLVQSDSPSDFLDQMTTLETFSADQKAVLDHAQDLVAVARVARADALAARQRATLAADRARAAFREIDVRKQAADRRIGQAEALLRRLTPEERAARIDDVGLPRNVVLGHNAGALALRIAMTRFEMPYVWGATGPRSFDCSGLVYWAFKKIGITMPRSSAEQATVGRPVAKEDLRPGDLVFFYNPVSHVGFYAGDGKVLNAVQTGDVVRYSDLSKMNFNSARRL
jgi:cell wall-associated NlpC family hydrolase